jgi:Flp pilus assembly pilin Flp
MEDCSAMTPHRLLRAVFLDEWGQGLAEYALMLALVGLVAVVALVLLATRVSSIFSTLAAAL